LRFILSPSEEFEKPRPLRQADNETSWDLANFVGHTRPFKGARGTSLNSPGAVESGVRNSVSKELSSWNTRNAVNIRRA
jgi:hypothetical protein